MKQSPKLPAEKRRAQLVKAALKVFGKKGYEVTTIDAIAREAGLTKGAFYFHFRSKEDVFFEVIRHINNRYLTAFEPLLKEGGDPEKAIIKIIHQGFVLVEDKNYFNLDLWQKAHKVKRIRAELESIHNHMRERLVDYFQRHTRLSRRECETLHDLLHTIFDGVIVQKQGLGGCVKMDNLEKNMIEMAQLFLRRK